MRLVTIKCSHNDDSFYRPRLKLINCRLVLKLTEEINKHLHNGSFQKDLFQCNFSFSDA